MKKIKVSLILVNKHILVKRIERHRILDEADLKIVSFSENGKMKRNENLPIEPETSKVNLSYHSHKAAPVLVNYED